MVSKRLFFFPLKQEKEERKHFWWNINPTCCSLMTVMSLSSAMANVGGSRKSQTRKKDSICLWIYLHIDILIKT
jgi:hypothetical protein